MYFGYMFWSFVLRLVVYWIDRGVIVGMGLGLQNRVRIQGRGRVRFVKGVVDLFVMEVIFCLEFFREVEVLGDFRLLFVFGCQVIWVIFLWVRGRMGCLEMIEKVGSSFVFLSVRVEVEIRILGQKNLRIGVKIEEKFEGLLKMGGEDGFRGNVDVGGQYVSFRFLCDQY